MKIILFCFFCFFVVSIEGLKFKKVIDKISNVAKGLTLQKIGGQAANEFREGAEALSKININSKSDVFVYSPDIKKAVQDLSHAVENAKLSIAIDEDTRRLLTDYQLLLGSFLNDFNESVERVADAAMSVGHSFEKGMGDFGTNAVLLANDVIFDVLVKVEYMSDVYYDRLDSCIDKVGNSFEKGLREHLKDAAIVLKEGIVLFNHTAVAVLLGVMFLCPPSSDMRRDWRWFLFVAAFGCVALYLSGGLETSQFPQQAEIPSGVENDISHQQNVIGLSSSDLLERITYVEERMQRKLNLANDKIDSLEAKLMNLDLQHDSFALETGAELQVLKAKSESIATTTDSLQTNLRTTTNMLMLVSNPLPIFPLLKDDAAFGASSHHPFEHHHPKNSRIHKPNRHGFDHKHTCWHRADGSGDHNYLQVDLGQLYYITQIQIRGREVDNQYVRKYKIGYVHHAMNVETTLTNLDGGVEFDGGYSGTAVFTNKYFKPFIARYVKLYVLEYHGNQCTNWEIFGVAMSDIDASIDPHVDHINALRLANSSP